MQDRQALNSTSIERAAQRAGRKAEELVAATRDTTNEALDQLEEGAEALQDKAPGQVRRFAAHVNDLAHRGLDHARDVGDRISLEAHRAGDRTVTYIRDEPVKSVLIAAAAGAALATLVGYIHRARGTSRD